LAGPNRHFDFQISSVPPISPGYHSFSDGVLFGPKGRNRLADPDAARFFMLGMVRCSDDAGVASAMEGLRHDILGNPLYSSIPSVQPKVGKTARQFHAKDDHPEIRAKVSLIHDVDDPEGKSCGTYLTRKGSAPQPQKIKSRWI
jgi:hypothetical protein